MPRPRRRWIVWGLAGLLAFVGMIVVLYFVIDHGSRRLIERSIPPSELEAYRKWCSEPITVDLEDFAPVEISEETQRCLFRLYGAARDIDWTVGSRSSLLLSRAHDDRPDCPIDHEAQNSLNDLRLAFRELVEQADFDAFALDGIDWWRDDLDALQINWAIIAQWSEAEYHIRHGNERAAMDEIEVLLQFARADGLDRENVLILVSRSVSLALDALEELEQRTDDPRISDAIRGMLQRHADDILVPHQESSVDPLTIQSVRMLGYYVAEGVPVTIPAQATGEEWSTLAAQAFHDHLEKQNGIGRRSSFVWMSSDSRSGLAFTYVQWHTSLKTALAANEYHRERYRKMMNSPVPASGS
ncbi:hypothetical protein KQI84_08925 [bacterium]|nr:hypothetical protein [bacterium]